jgi:hypothetical protein
MAPAGPTVALASLASYRSPKSGLSCARTISADSTLSQASASDSRFLDKTVCPASPSKKPIITHKATIHHPALQPPLASDIRPRSEYRHLQPSLLHHQQPSFADQHSPLPRLLCPLGVFCLPLRVNLEIPIFAREHRVLTHAPRRPDSHRRRSVEYVFSLTSNTL